MATSSAPGLLARLTDALPSLPRREHEPTVEDRLDVPEPVLCRGECDGTEVLGPSIETVADVHGDDFDWFLVQDAPINEKAVVTVCDECNGIAGTLGLGH